MARSDPNGLLVRFEVEQGERVTLVETGLSDGEDFLANNISVGSRPGGPVYRGLVWKPVVNGTWDLILRAYEPGFIKVAETVCPHSVTVTF